MAGVTYVVKPGDNLMKIAGEQYGNQRMFAEIMRLNNLTSGMIKAGMVLRMPANKPNEQISISQGLMSGVGQENAKVRQAAGLPTQAFGQGAPTSSFVTPQTTVTSLDTLGAMQNKPLPNVEMRGRGYVPPKSNVPTSVGPMVPRENINLPNLRYNIEQAQRDRFEAQKARAVAPFTTQPSQIPGGSGGITPMVSAPITMPGGIATPADAQKIYEYGKAVGIDKYGQAPASDLTFKGGRAYVGNVDVTRQVEARNAAVVEQRRQAELQKQYTTGTGTRYYTDWETVQTEAQADPAKKAALDQFNNVLANPGSTLPKEVALQILKDWRINPTTVAGKKMVDQLMSVTPGLSYSANDAATNEAISNLQTELWNIGQFGTPPIQMQVQNGSTGGGGNAGFDYRYGGGMVNKGF